MGSSSTLWPAATPPEMLPGDRCQVMRFVIGDPARPQDEDDLEPLGAERTQRVVMMLAAFAAPVVIRPGPLAVLERLQRELVDGGPQMAVAGKPEPDRELLAAAVCHRGRPGVRLQVPGSKTRVSLPLEFCVKDNGNGVPADLLPHLFDPFVTTKPTGTGLGLALVAKIVGDHGGIIECESQPRHTIFRVLMPMFTGDDALPGGGA